MNCISSGRYHLLWNREKTNDITPTRGLYQGDPLSSYIFVLCMEQLSHWVKHKVDRGSWKGLKTSRRSSTISHIFFADDVLFVEADQSQIEVIKEGLSLFSTVSGQRINISKSFILVSPNTPLRKESPPVICWDHYYGKCLQVLRGQTS